MKYKKLLGIFLCLSLFVGGLTFWPKPDISQATISSETTRKTYAGNGSTTVFPYPFKVFASTDLLVILRDASGNETTQTVNVHYTVSGVGVGSGGNVTMTTAPPEGEILAILRDAPLTQSTDYIEGGKFPAESHESALDRLTMIVQQLQEQLNRSTHLKRTETYSTTELPNIVAGKILGWNASGDGVANYDNSGTVTVANIDYIGNYGDSLTTAIASIGSTPTTLLIHKEVILTQADTTPSTLHLWFLQEGKITLGAYNLTINGPMTALIAQIFDDSGAGSVGFGTGYVKEVYPQWWGAVGDGIDESAEIQSAIDAAESTGGTRVKFLYTGTGYGISTGLTLTSENVILDFDPGTTIKALANITMLTISKDIWRYGIIGAKFDGNDIASKGILIADGEVASNNGYAVFKNVSFSGFNTAAFEAYGLIYSSFDNCNWDGNDGTGLILSGASNVNVFNRCNWIDNAVDIKLLAQSDSNTFIRPVSENRVGSSVTTHNIEIDDSDNNEFIGFHNENNVVPSNGYIVYIHGTSEANKFLSGHISSVNNGGYYFVVGNAGEGDTPDGNMFKNVNIYNGSTKGIHLVKSIYTIIEDCYDQNWDAEIQVVEEVDAANTKFIPKLRKTLYNNVAADQTLVITDDGKTYDVDATAATKTLTLPAADSNRGYQIVVRKRDTSTNAVIVARAGTDTIFYEATSVTTFSMYGVGNYIRLVSDGANWRIVEYNIDIEASANWNPGSIAVGAMEATDVTVTGAVLGDYAIASFSLDVVDLVLNAQVTASNTVTCVLANNTAGAVDLAEGTIRVIVTPK